MLRLISRLLRPVTLRRSVFLLLVLVGIVVTVQYLHLTTTLPKVNLPGNKIMSILKNNLRVVDLNTATSDAPPIPTEDPVTKSRRETVRDMMQEAFQAYMKYAWGANELGPVSKRRQNSGMLGRNLGVTIVDSLDTLWIMGLKDEYEKGRKWVREKFRMKGGTHQLSVFETTIRFLGGFLAIYALTGDKLYISKAQEVADSLLPAFDTPSGIPAPMINTATKDTHFHGWVPGASCTVLADMGTLHMEFTYLSEVTGNPKYSKVVQKGRQSLLLAKAKYKGLYPTSISTVNGEGCDSSYTLGALGDSFYEYLLKEFLRSGDPVALQMYRDSLEGIDSRLVGGRYLGGGLLCAGRDSEMSDSSCVMEHLSCFAGGLFALGANFTQKHGGAAKWMSMGANVTKTCYEAYRSTATGLSGDKFRVSASGQVTPVDTSNKLRPEAVESLFVMWRLTGEQKYRDWGWRIAKSFQLHSRVAEKKGKGPPAHVWRREVIQHRETLPEYAATKTVIGTSGYSGLNDVTDVNGRGFDDTQQSFFLAETLKYMYLLFCDSSVLPLDQWVFNTEAHPFPVRSNVSAVVAAESAPLKIPRSKSKSTQTKSNPQPHKP